MNKFKTYCGELYGQYNNSIKRITVDSTEMIFNLIKHNNHELHHSKKIHIGKFYIIRYKYNNLKIWCPIFVLDDSYDTITHKRIIRAINIDYLPYSYRILFFNILFDKSESIIKHNENNDTKYEKPIKLKFNIISDILKRLGNYGYSITGFDYEKIDGVLNGSPKIFFVSTTFVNRFIFINTKIVNLKYMKDMSINSDNYQVKVRLNDLITDFDKIKENFNSDEQKEYHMELKKIEQKYKKIMNT